MFSILSEVKILYKSIKMLHIQKIFQSSSLINYIHKKLFVISVLSCSSGSNIENNCSRVCPVRQFPQRCQQPNAQHQYTDFPTKQNLSYAIDSKPPSKAHCAAPVLRSYNQPGHSATVRAIQLAQSTMGQIYNIY